MTQVGAILFDVKLNLASIDSQVRALQGRLNGQKLDLNVGTGKASENFGKLNSQIGQVKGSLIGVTKEQGNLNAATGVIAGVAGAGAFIALNAAVQVVQGSVSALVGTFTEASSEFRKLEANLLSFQAKTQNITVDMAGLKDEIRSVARTTSQTEATLSETASSLVSLGVAGTEVEDRLKPLAQASDVLGESTKQLGKVTQAALASYRQYGVGVEEVTDVIVQALNTTAIENAQEFEQLFSRAAGPAASFGVTIQELTAAFAVLRESGASPFAAASGLETLLNRIASRADELKREGVDVAFKENGGVDLEKTLINIKKRTEELSPTEQSQFLSRQLGESVGADTLGFLNKIEGSYAKATENVNAFSGAQQRAFDIVSQGTEFQDKVFQGLISSAITILGETLNPIEKGFISLKQSISNAVNVDLGPLQTAAKALGEAFGQNPELAEQLTNALTRLSSVSLDVLVSGIEAVTNVLSNPETTDKFITGFVDGFIAAKDLIGELLTALQPLASFTVNLAIAGVDVLQASLPVAQALGGAVESLSGLFEGLSNNSEALAVALQTLALAFVGVKVAAFATGMQAAIAAAGGLIPVMFGAAGAVGSFAAATLAAVPPLAVLAAAVAAANFIKFTNELRAANEELEALRNASQVGTGGGIQIAEGIKNSTKAISDALEDGKAVNAEQKRQVEERIRLGEAEIAALQQQRSEIASAQPENQSQRNTQQALLGENQVTTRALENQIKAAKTALDNVKKAEEALAAGDTPGGFDERTPDEGLSAEGQLKEFKRQQDIVLNGIEEASKQARTRLEGLDLPERDNAEQAAQIERTALEDRLKNREKFLADLQALSGRQGISVEESTKIESEIAATEKAIADDRLAIAQNLRGQRQRTREEELRLFEEEKSIAESRLQLENQGRTDAVLSNQLSGVSSAQSAAEQIAAIQQDSTRQAIANKQTEIAEVRRLEGLKVFEAEDADARVRALQVELASLNGSLIQGEIDARANQIDEQLAGLQRIQEARQIEASIVDQAISNQRGLLEANLSITQALNQLDQTRLEGALNRARAEGNVFAAVSAQGAIFESQVKALKQEFAAKRATATITEAQTRLENQRAIAVAEVAAIEARLAVDKARNSGASAAEVAGLTQIADLREAQVGSARDTAAVQDQILAKSREELGIQERLTAEKLRQNALDEARNKLTDAQRGIISALAAESNTSVQDSRDNLARIRDNLKEAQRAGLFQGGQGKVEGAIRDVQQALRSSNSDQALLRLLKQNPDNPQIRQLIDSIGRSDLTGLVEASENFKEATLNFDKALEVFGSTQKGTAEVRQAGIESAIGALGIDDRFGAVDALNVKNDPLAALGVVTDLQSQLDALRSSGRTGAGIDARAADLQGRIQAVQLQNPELTFPELLAQVQAIFAKISEEGFAAGTDIGNLTVTTPDPVADTSKIVNDIANMTASEVNA